MSLAPHDLRRETPSETVASLRELYRAAEARLARLRLIVEAGEALAEARPSELDGVVAHWAGQAATFAGYHGGSLEAEPRAGALNLPVAARRGGRIGHLALTRADGALPPLSPEDTQTLELLGRLIALAIDNARQSVEREALLDSVKASEARLAEVLAGTLAVQEEERRRLSRDLHDGAAQIAGATLRMLEALKARTAGSLDEAAQRDLDRAETLAARSVREIRGLIGNLRPTQLDDLGLVAAIRAETRDLVEAGHPVEVRAELADEVDLSPERQTALFRIVQEALSNIGRHAGAGCAVRVSLTVATDGSVALAIADSGVGLDIDAARPRGQHPRLGLAVMAERARSQGGRAEIAPGLDGGTVVSVALPPEYPGAAR